MESLNGVRHFVRCRCFLPRHHDFFQFPVFSIVDGNDVKVKFAQCPNCGIVHRVHEIGKSTIMNGKEHMGSILTVSDVRLSVDQRLSTIMEQHEIDDVSAWEELKFIIDHERWGEFVVLSREREGNDVNVKILRILNRTMCVVDVETRSDILQV